MKFNNKQITGTYAEIGQTNPLRWTNLFREEDGSFTRQSFKWKCKDFLNEIVSKGKGNKTCVYGYECWSWKVNPEGEWMLLEHIVDKKVFLENLGSINKWVEASGYPPVEFLDEEELVIMVPRKYFENTYSISFISYFIRVANCQAVVKDWNDHPTKSIDNPFGPTHYPTVMKQGVKPPVPDYWYYIGKKNTALGVPDSYSVHNNGVNGWLTACMMDGIVV